MHSDLFNQSAADWHADPRKTFDAWLASRHFRGSSADVYRAQFHHFLDWLAERGKHLLNTEPALIDEFVGTLEVKRQQRARYLRIMERVFDDMFQQTRAPGNPARPVARSIDATWADTRSNAPTGFLSDAERDNLWRALASAVDPDVELHWRDLRDRALAAVLLGTGLKLGEAEALTLSDITPWRDPVAPPDAASALRLNLLIRGDDPRFSRRVQLCGLAAHIVQRWLTVRSAQEIAADRVFPAGRGGRTMHKATVLRAIDSLVEAAGLLPPSAPAAVAPSGSAAERPARPNRTVPSPRSARISPQTLRNAYAATLFEAGESDDEVAERLGFAQSLSSKRLRAAWHDWLGAQAHRAAVREAVAQANSDSEPIGAAGMP